MAITQVCPRCRASLFPSRDEEAEGDCLNCGPIYISTLTDPSGDAEAERNPFGRERARAAHRKHDATHDGCDESPSCLTCPLPECKYVGQPERQYGWKCRYCRAFISPPDGRIIGKHKAYLCPNLPPA